MTNLRVWGIRAFLLCAAWTLIALNVTTASAQTFRGTILGTVTDTSGAAILNAKVTIRNVDTGIERMTETNGDGTYIVPELPIGNYKVTITQAGFQSAVTNGVVVDVASERRIDAVLKPGQVNQQVIVEGDTLPQIDTTTNTLGSTLTQNNVKDLPHQRPRLHKIDLPQPGCGGLAGPDHRFAGIVWRILDEWRARSIQQLFARRHRYE